MLLRPKKAQLRATRRRPDRDDTEPGYRSGLELELISSLTSLRSRHVRMTAQFTCKQEQGNPMTSGTAPHSSELRHYTPYPENSGSHLGSTLKPGGAVLTLGVSRRSGSVAYIRADASPNEVLTPLMMHEHRARVNSPRLGTFCGHTTRADQPL